MSVSGLESPGRLSRRAALRVLGTAVGALTLSACAAPAAAPSASQTQAPAAAGTTGVQVTSQPQAATKPAANPVEDVPAWTPLNATGQPKPGGTLRMGIVGGQTGTLE